MCFFLLNNQLFVRTRQQDEAIKSRGIKVKEKEVRGSERPMGGFEKATRQRKKTKDPKASDSAMEANTSSASGFEKPTRKRKKVTNDPKTSHFPIEAVTHSHPYNTVLV